MKMHRALKKAYGEKDIDALMSLIHEDYEFIRHQSGTILKKPEYRVMISGMLAATNYKEVMQRCIYENDDILVEHSVKKYQDGSRESLIAVKMLVN
jgi:hypothetical protein